jgi:hypothetical protein
LAVDQFLAERLGCRIRIVAEEFDDQRQESHLRFGAILLPIDHRIGRDAQSPTNMTLE